jgi:hypothetical protein
VISKISEKFYTRFTDFDSLKPELQLFNNPMDIKVTQHSGGDISLYMMLENLFLHIILLYNVWHVVRS